LGNFRTHNPNSSSSSGGGGSCSKLRWWWFDIEWSGDVNASTEAELSTNMVPMTTYFKSGNCNHVVFVVRA